MIDFTASCQLMEILLTSVEKFSLSEINVNFLSKRVKCVTLVILPNSMEVRTVLVLHVKAPVKPSLGCIQINPMDKSREICILR